MKNKQWSYLKPGDIVDVIAPGTGCDPSVVDKAKTFLTNWGLRYQIPENILGKDLLCANPDNIRFKHLKDALLNKKSKAVWCLRGGYGCTRLIPLLQELTPPSHCKLFMGFSDITAFHLFLQKKWRWSTVHGPSLNQSVMNTVAESSVQKLRDIIFNKQPEVSFANLIPLNNLAKKKLVLDSTVIGGNLSLVQTSLGTSWQPNTNNKIVFLEEVNERGYRVDRMLQHLQQAGIFSNITALVLGDFTGGVESDGQSLIPQVLQAFAKHCDFPVLQVNGIGHGKVNDPIPLGTPAVLQLGKNPRLICANGGR